MPLETRLESGRAQARILGELCIYSAADTKVALIELLARAREIEVDLSGVTEIDTAGFQLLALLKREAAAAGKTASFARHSPQVLRLFDLFNAGALFGDPVVIPSAAS